MAEYPPRSCGKCPYLGKYNAIASEQGDFLAGNSVPEPNVRFQSKNNLNEDLLGVNHAYQAPDLKVSPLPGDKKYGLQDYDAQDAADINVNGYNGRGFNGSANGRNGINGQNGFNAQNGVNGKNGYGGQNGTNGSRTGVGTTPSGNKLSERASARFKFGEGSRADLPAGVYTKEGKECCSCIRTLPKIRAAENQCQPQPGVCCAPTCCICAGEPKPPPDPCDCTTRPRDPLKKEEPCPDSPYNLTDHCADKEKAALLSAAPGPVESQQLGVVGARHTPYGGGLPTNGSRAAIPNGNASRLSVGNAPANGVLLPGKLTVTIETTGPGTVDQFAGGGQLPNQFAAGVESQQLGVVGAAHTPYGGGVGDTGLQGVRPSAVQFAQTPSQAGLMLTPSGQQIQPSGDQAVRITESQQLRGILKNKSQAQIPCPCEDLKGQVIPGTDKSGQMAGLDAMKGEQEGRPECYLPQPEDKIPVDMDRFKMGPIGPWATGRVDWGPMAGLTGTRPVVDKYSIARFSEGDWRSHNKDMLDNATREQHRANLVEWNSRQCLEQTRADIDKNQEDNTKRLSQRAKDVHRWKCELERAIAAAAEEIELMEEQRRRLKSASRVLMLPESIAGECLERRTGRLDPELVRDEVEEELIKELALTAELRETFYRTLKDVEMQLLEDKTAKQRLEYDWSDKKEAHECEAINVALNNNSTVLLFKPGSTIFPNEQSTIEYWEHFTRETLMEAESTRQRSVVLRSTLDAILINAARDLRAQADRVEMALAKRIACTEEIRIHLENELKKILQRLADVETIMKDLRTAIRNMDTPMKKAQTRLYNRLQRHRVENCRDEAHFGLVEEVKLIGEGVAQLQAQLNQAIESQSMLIKARSDLEREIMVKRKTLEIDRDRTALIRSYYPSANALSGN